MITPVWIALLSIVVLVSVLIQLFAPGSGLLAVITGLLLVVGGTLLTAVMSHSRQAVVALWRHVREFRIQQSVDETEENGFQNFLQAANFYRRGEIRPAEAVIQEIEDPLLRRGAQLVVDGFPRDQINLSLQRQIADDRNHLRRPAEMVRSMSGYAPAFGMLGTLLGLIQMLFGLGSGDLGTIGAAMGFAMLTTVYGLVLANLVLKPVASKLEEHGRKQIARRVAYLQAVMLLCDKQHAELIREMMEEIERKQEMPEVRPQFELAASR
ncbi:MAG: MotA/TolQ/ExbB proton channel family protein [Candidatus Thiodiazotropha sp. (ex Monitilora ramsayi)]|nr:MotA/TolQ/ExbB proton channel family protein [Candidatus Thiodiazotropha sp. (ex Monitilora ramsayi)]